MTSIQHLVRFTTDAGALERILRFLQCLFQILAVYAVKTEDIKRCLLLRRQFALGRRYFRFFRWIDCFHKAYDAFVNKPGLMGVLQVGKWSCLGGYLALESATLLDTMGVYSHPWASTCLLEGNRFWFYSLVFSIVWSLSLLIIGDSTLSQPPTQDEKLKVIKGKSLEAQRKEKRKEEKKVVLRRLVADCADLFIPGAMVGWIPVGPAVSGGAGLVSTWITGVDVWERLRG